MENANNPYDFSGLMDSFKSLIGSPELMFQMIALFPIPIEVFDSDGTAIFMNRAHMELHNIQDANLIVGKYNLLHDPVCHEILGLENIRRVFRGEAVNFPDFPIPIQDLVDRRVIDEKPYESATMDCFCLPVWSGDKFLYTLCIFILKHQYTGRPEIAKAKEYIDAHWLDSFSAEAVANAVYVSKKHLDVLFRQSAGMTMHDYYSKVKLGHIKEKLADKSLTIAEVFSLCGEDGRGAFAKTFKKLTGMTPTEYRNSLK